MWLNTCDDGRPCGECPPSGCEPVAKDLCGELKNGLKRPALRQAVADWLASAESGGRWPPLEPSAIREPSICAGSCMGGEDQERQDLAYESSHWCSRRPAKSTVNMISRQFRWRQGFACIGSAQRIDGSLATPRSFACWVGLPLRNVLWIRSVIVSAAVETKRLLLSRTLSASEEKAQ